MSWFKRKKQQKSSDLEGLFSNWLSQASSSTGIPINHRTVLQLTTALACVRVIAEDIAQLPFKLYQSRSDGSSELALGHPLYRLINIKPNDWQTSFEFREQIGLHLTITNNAYVWINRVGERIVELLPLEPQLVTPNRKDFATSYCVTLLDGTQMTLQKNEIWHLRGLSWDGWRGLDGIRLMRESVSLGLALEKHGSKMFKNGASVGGLISTDQTLNDKQRKDLRDDWESRHSGAENAYKTAILWGGMKYTPMATANDSAQFLESRRFQVEDVCRVFKVFPIMVGHSDKTATYASADQMFLAHFRQTINPWLVRIEQSADCNLLTDAEIDSGLGTKFTRNALMSMAYKDRSEYYGKMYSIGAMNPNEIRALEEMNPYDGGEQYRVPLNMTDPSAPIEAIPNAN